VRAATSPNPHLAQPQQPARAHRRICIYIYTHTYIYLSFSAPLSNSSCAQLHRPILIARNHNNPRGLIAAYIYIYVYTHIYISLLFCTFKQLFLRAATSPNPHCAQPQQSARTYRRAAGCCASRRWRRQTARKGAPAAGIRVYLCHVYTCIYMCICIYMNKYAYICIYTYIQSSRCRLPRGARVAAADGVRRAGSFSLTA